MNYKYNYNAVYTAEHAHYCELHKTLVLFLVLRINIIIVHTLTLKTQHRRNFVHESLLSHSTRCVHF